MTCASFRASASRPSNWMNLPSKSNRVVLQYFISFSWIPQMKKKSTTYCTPFLCNPVTYNKNYILNRNASINLNIFAVIPGGFSCDICHGARRTSRWNQRTSDTFISCPRPRYWNPLVNVSDIIFPVRHKFTSKVIIDKRTAWQPTYQTLNLFAGQNLSTVQKYFPILTFLKIFSVI